MKNKTKLDEKHDKMRALYDAAPYPESLAGEMEQEGTVILEHWINAVTAVDTPAFHATSRILVAGCGTGAEVMSLAQQFPNAQFVGVDFSEKSIALAVEKAAHLGVTNAIFEVADLTVQDWITKYDAFDFIICHGVADYVQDIDALFQTLANCLTDNGVLYLTGNTPYHPAKRIQQGFSALGWDAAVFEDTAEQRNLLQAMTSLMGQTAGIDNLGNRPKAYLNIDIFPPIAHHLSIEGWCEVAQKAGLFFCGSMDAPRGLTKLTDAQLAPFYALGKAALSIWMANMQQEIGMQLLFSKRTLVEPTFHDLVQLQHWKPKLAACVGTLPPMTGDLAKVLPLMMKFDGLPDFVLNTTAYDLEVLRYCNGQNTLAAIITHLPQQESHKGLIACLFRAYHYGLLV